MSKARPKTPDADNIVLRLDRSEWMVLSMSGYWTLTTTSEPSVSRAPCT